MSRSELEQVLRSRQLAVTAELSPPDSADPQEVYKRAELFAGHVDALNATDGSGANSLAADSRSSPQVEASRRHSLK